jgi:hypothetical protein
VVQLETGWTWTGIYCTPGTLNYEVTQEMTDNGPLYTHTITGFVPDDDRSRAIDLASLMSFRRHLVRFTDNSGCRRLLGTPVEGLELTYAAATGEDVPNDRGYTVRLQGVTTSPGDYYE